MCKIILIDGGHGYNTPGKCSPDKSLYEWEIVRELAAYTLADLRDLGIESYLLVQEIWDVPLSERIRRVNNMCKRWGSSNVLLLSYHVNAAGSDGKWHNARGFLPFVAPNASNDSKRFARYLYEEVAENRGLKGNRWISKDKYAVKSLAMCRETMCPAVLTENLFQDNKEDVEYLLSEEGKMNIVEGHVAAIKRYLGL